MSLPREAGHESMSIPETGLRLSSTAVFLGAWEKGDGIGMPGELLSWQFSKQYKSSQWPNMAESAESAAPSANIRTRTYGVGEAILCTVYSILHTFAYLGSYLAELLRARTCGSRKDVGNRSCLLWASAPKLAKQLAW